MATLVEEKESLLTALQSLSKKLAAVPSNSRFIEPHITEIKTLATCIDEIASLLQKGENEKDLQSKSAISRELGDVFYEVDNFLQLVTRRKYHFKISEDIKAINSKLAKSLAKLQLIDLYNPEHDIAKMNSEEEKESFYTNLQTLSIKLAVASSNSEFMEPHCVRNEINTLTSCFEEIASMLKKCEKDKPKHSMRKLFREFSGVFYEVGTILQFLPQKSFHKIALIQLRAVNGKLAKSLKKLQFMNLSTPRSVSNETYNSKEKMFNIYQKALSEHRSNTNMLAESLEEEKSFSKILQNFSTNLESISSNAKFLQTSTINMELESISSYIEELKSMFLMDGTDYQRKGVALQEYWCQELSNIFYEIECSLQLPFQKGGTNQIANDLKESRMKIDKIVKKIHSSNDNFITQHDITTMRISKSPVEALTISGSRDEKEKIIDLLLSFKETRQTEPCLIPIAQKGAAKTTEFAQNIINDARVVHHFNRIIWIEASYLIGTRKLDMLVKKKASTLFWVHKTMNKNCEEEQVLLVLDDIKKAEIVNPGDRYYSVDRKWRTKNTVVIKTCKSSSWFKGNPHVPTSSKLSVNEAWKMVAENSISGKLNPKFEEIGRDILKKFETWKINELMIKALSRLLLSNVNLDYWKLVRESAIWKLPFYEEMVIANVLELCYTCDTSRYPVGNLNCKVVGTKCISQFGPSIN